MDGVVLSYLQYQAAEKPKSIEIEIDLLPAWLDILSPGEHLFTVVLDDEKAVTVSFTVEEQMLPEPTQSPTPTESPASETLPQTGDSSSILFWLVTVQIGLLGLGGLLFTSRHKSLRFRP